MSDPKQPVNIDPMPAYREAMAMNDFLQNRCLILANEIHRLNGVVRDQAAELLELKEKIEAEAASAEEASAADTVAPETVQ